MSSYTDIFNGYFDNPSSQYASAGLSPCAGASSANDISFDFGNKNGIISNNKNTLSEFTLSDIHTPVTQWMTNSKILYPKTLTYLEGIGNGQSYESKWYYLPTDVYGESLFNYFSNISFTINYTSSTSKAYNVVSDASYGSQIDFVNSVNALLLSQNIPVEISIQDSSYLKIVGTDAGFNFSISSDIVLTTIDVSVDGNSPFLTSTTYTLAEDLSKYVSPMKYPNGAFRGLLLKVTYPEYNSDSITDYQRSIKINHIKDNIITYQQIVDDPSIVNNSSANIYKQIDFNVISSYYNVNDINTNGWLNGGTYFSNGGFITTNSTITPSGWINATGLNNATLDSISNYGNQLGMYGYLEWVEQNDMWVNIGTFYSIITAEDYLDSSIKNYAGSLLIYNPNDYPVKINYMMFI